MFKKTVLLIQKLLLIYAYKIKVPETHFSLYLTTYKAQDDETVLGDPI